MNPNFTRLLLFLPVLLLLFPLSLRAQDPVFSQFYAAPMQINPAFAGNSYAPRVALNYRNQWPGIASGAYETFAASFDQYFESINSGVGLFLLTDDAGAGILRTVKVSGIYAYRLQLSDDWFVKLGIEGGYVQSRLDWNKLLFGDQIDPETGAVTPGGSVIPTQEQQPQDLNPSYLDLGTGLLFYNSVFYGGLSLKHVNQPNNSFFDASDNLNSGLPMRLTLHAGAEFDLNTNNIGGGSAFISPNVLYASQGNFRQVNAGLYAGFGMFFGGAWFRHTFGNADAVIGLVGVRYKEFKIGYSFDATVSDLQLTTSGGSHEISVGIEFNQPRRTDYNDCLKMFR